MARFRLEEEEEIGVLLEFPVIWVVALRGVYFFEGPLDFPLLDGCKGIQSGSRARETLGRTSSRAILF